MWNNGKQPLLNASKIAFYKNIVKNNFKRSLTTSICFVFSSYDSKRVIDKGII